MPFFNGSDSAEKLRIITVDSPEQSILKKKTEDIAENELPLAREVAKKLYSALYLYLPAAGLAAPQIGISKSVFIFSYDRNPENLQTIINPSFIPIGNEKLMEWEGCFSVILSGNAWKLAKVSRYEKIKAFYLSQEGKKREMVLEGFAAKVFQHECDHLQGIVNIDREDATIKEFGSQDALLCFMQTVKKEEEAKYRMPSKNQ